MGIKSFYSLYHKPDGLSPFMRPIGRYIHIVCESVIPPLENFALHRRRARPASPLPKKTPPYL